MPRHNGISPGFYKAVPAAVKCPKMKKKQHESQETSSSNTRWWKFSPFNVCLGVLISATLILAVINLRTYYLEALLEQETLDLQSQKSHLRPVRLDAARFEVEVVKPYRDMRAKFADHPDMIIKKLSKFVDMEKNKTDKLLSNIHELKSQLGFQNFESRRRKRSLEKNLCPERSPYLLGPLYVKQNDIPDMTPGSSDFISHFGSTLTPGGASKPDECLARTKLAVIVAFRDRAEHLKIFLHHMHPILQRQLLDYRIFVIEQAPGQPFNRGALMNIGYKEALKLDNFDCFVMHDVDLVPEDDRNIYECPSSGPKHMSVAVNKWKYRLQYPKYIGGVTTLSTEKYEQINGFANTFYGWGGEDDDLMHRVTMQNFTVNRSPAHLSRFFMLRHGMSEKNNDLDVLMKKSVKNQLDADGLTTLKYAVKKHQNYPLYTWFLVELPPAPTYKPKNFWNSFKNSVSAGMNYAAGGLASNLADKAVKYASQKDEEEMEYGDKIY